MKNLIIIILGAVFISICVNNKDYVEIPSTSIRMRVIAASNRDEDQRDKLIVKSALEEVVKGLDISKNYNALDHYFEDNKSSIDDEIKEIITSKQKNISFTSNYGYNYFPEKEWKGVVYPSGNYKSYVITIGEGLGENWWCVMYPPLCLIDNKSDEYTYRSLIKDVLAQYN